MKEKKIAREERNQEKLANGDWVMAEFYATWCPHCQRMKPVVEEFKKLMEGTLEVVLVDIDQEWRECIKLSDDEGKHTGSLEEVQACLYELRLNRKQ